MTDGRYASAPAVETAIRNAARSASAADASITVGDRVRQEYFRRFLSRVFSDAEAQGWILKGGTGVLARVASARATKDIDLIRRERSLDGALDDLRRLAEIDLGDYFRFEYTGHDSAVGGQQAYAEGYHVTFDVYIGANGRGTLSVDLVVNVIVTDEPTIASPANGLHLPRLTSRDYHLYPVVDQIADKVCATLSDYNGRPSSREWDLVDLVVLATTETISGARLRQALIAESRVRNLDLPERFSVPASWGRRYAKDARPVPACAEYRSVGEALALIASFVDPVLTGSASGKTWSNTRRAWG